MNRCTRQREAWLESALDASALDAGAAGAPGEHLEACAECRAWLARRRDQVAALRSLGRPEVPATLEERLRDTLAPEHAASAFEARLERRLAALPGMKAPAVLDRLVAEELEDPLAARATRFAGDLARPVAPGVLDLRVESIARRSFRSRRRSWAWVSGAAAAALAFGLFLAQPNHEAGRPFTVHYGRPDSSSALEDGVVAGLVDGWTGGILRAGGEPAAEEGR